MTRIDAPPARSRFTAAAFCGTLSVVRRPVNVLLLVGGALALFAAGCGGDDDSGSAETPAATSTTEETHDNTTEETTEDGGETTEHAGDAANGETVFASAGCGGCHTFEAAGSSGAVGPNLDDAHPSYDKVVTQVTNGGGAMPAFGDELSEQEIQDVAAFVSGGSS
jgi:mono/diheme cytochrome c family protein